MILIALYIATIPAANWLIGNVGTACIPQGPCLIPVFPGIMAPSGVVMIGAALVLRDLVQRRFGAPVSLGCVLAGTVLSFFIASPSLALASAAAFLVSELADFAVYTPLAKRRFALAVVLSCAAGAVVDSALFLWLAFGSLEHVSGQIIGKLYAALAFIAWRRRCIVLGHAFQSDGGDYTGTCRRCCKRHFFIHDGSFPVRSDLSHLRTEPAKALETDR